VDLDSKITEFKKLDNPDDEMEELFHIHSQILEILQNTFAEI